ncbi:MAG: lipoate--protein ligase family protein [Anaerolineales bacterium]|nr:lipoate--protein ligase family protein [Anaerolineales bacterium]
MAVDEAILQAIGRGDVLPTLRLYAWDPPCLSLGYAQSFSDVDHEQLNGHGWDVVRRITGGRAILHTDELTYSVIGHHDEPRFAGSVIESYQRLSQGLLEALHLLELPAEALPKSSEGAVTQEPVCFEAPSHFEITVNDKKLIGSAQARKKAGVLQHGTLPLFGDLTRITDVLVFPSDEDRINAGKRLLKRATTIETAMGPGITWEQAAAAVCKAFSTTFTLKLEPAELTSTELAQAEEFVEEKYAHPSWTERI